MIQEKVGISRNLSLPIITKVVAKQRKHFPTRDSIQPFLDFPQPADQVLSRFNARVSKEWEFKPSQKIFPDQLSRKTLDLGEVNRTELFRMKKMIVSMYRHKQDSVTDQDQRLRQVRERIERKRRQKIDKLNTGSKNFGKLYNLSSQNLK